MPSMRLDRTSGGKARLRWPSRPPVPEAPGVPTDLPPTSPWSSPGAHGSASDLLRTCPGTPLPTPAVAEVAMAFLAPRDYGAQLSDPTPYPFLGHTLQVLRISIWEVRALPSHLPVSSRDPALRDLRLKGSRGRERNLPRGAGNSVCGAQG